MLAFSLRSLWNRRFTASLTALAIALSVALILGVERLRDTARDGFANSASGIDLIVAPRGNSVQILMATVFGLGGTGTGMEWESFEWLEEQPNVAWAVPIQMGDNHRGYPVIGTQAAYFEHFRHSGGQPLSLSMGAFFEDDVSDSAVIGAEVAARFDYEPGTVIVNAHGTGAVSFDVHDDAPFTITGVLAPTGTAVDRMVLVSLAGFDAIHATEEVAPDPLATDLSGDVSTDTSVASDDAVEAAHEGHGEHDHSHDNHAARENHYGHNHSHDDHDHSHDDHAAHKDHDGHDHSHDDHAAHKDHGEHDHSHDDHAAHEGHDGHDDHGHHHAPGMINAAYIGLTDRTNVLGLQRAVNDLPSDALSAVLPAVALSELWGITGTAERVMQLMAWAVAVAGVIGMIVMLSAGLDARRREFAILRAVGATPSHILRLILAEAALLMAAGLVIGLALLGIATLVANPILLARFGIEMPIGLFGAREAATLAGLFAVGLIAALIPAIRVYRATLADGLTVRT